MKAKKGIVDFLNKVLTNELTAINQYFLHGEMCGNWGYDQLHKEIKKHAIDEMKHAEQIIEHILYLEGFPNLQRLGTLNIGETVPEQFKPDLVAVNEDTVEIEQDGARRLGHRQSRRSCFSPSSGSSPVCFW